MAQFEAFVPALVRTRLASGSASLWHPSADTLQAPVLFADLSGFSVLAERLALKGSRGAEDLKDLLNLFFGRLVDLVHAHAGQIVSFPGDAVLALWPVSGEDAVAQLGLAARCGLAAQEAFGASTRDATKLELRVGIGFGDVWAANVGGVADCWHLVVAGDSLTQAVQALKAAKPGEVVISREAWDRLSPYATAHWTAARGVRLKTVTTPADLPLQSIEVPPAEEPALRRYVPLSIVARIDAGQTEWLAEFRRLSVLFVNLGPLDCSAPDALDRLQAATTIVQTAVHHYGGNIGNIVVDDKGTVLDCGWGLALHAHADDAVRAARTAIDVRRRLAAVGVTASLGLATGDVFTGLRGNQARCDFAMIGNVVNLAAAMMQFGRGEIVCDATFCDSTRQWCHFEPLDPVLLKGHDEPLETYRLVDVARAGPAEIVGRLRERKVLEERFEKLLNDGTGSVVVIEGDAGIGKSRLLAAMMERALAHSVRVMLVRGDALERSAPYHVWRGLFDTLLGLGEHSIARERRLLALLESATALAPFASLLNPVLGLSLEENERCRSVTPRGRAVLTRDLLVHLFSRAIGNQPTLLVLDDTHWFDSASWVVAEGIERELPHVLLLIATRPVPHDKIPEELARFRARESTSVLQLEALAAHETRALVCQRLRSRALDGPVERLILEKAEGHPFFTEELAHALLDRGLVHVEDGVCRFAGAAAAAESVMLPTTVRVMVSSRIDQLSIPQQLTAKVASVLGRSLDLASLRAIYPIEIPLDELEEHLKSLIEHELIRVVSDVSPHIYEFKHAITQEVAYSLLPHAQRRPLHAVVARFYERQHASDLSRFYPLLADHWGRAGASDRALFYCEKAGYDALGRFANAEAIRFFTEALAIEARLEPEATSAEQVVLPNRIVSGRDARRTQWHRCLGEAYVNRGMWSEGWAHLEGALATVGYPLPASSASWGKGIAAQVATQVGHWLRRPVLDGRSDDVEELLIDTVRALQRIGSVSYVMDRKAPLFYCVIAALNLAERLKPTLELAALYASAGNISGLIPFHPLARAYIDRARCVGRSLNDPAVDARILGRTSVYRLAIGDWTACDDVERSMALSDQVGDPFQWEESAAIRARAAHLRGEYELAVSLGGEICKRSVASGTAVHEIWGLDAEAWGLLYLGQHAKALQRSKSGLAMPERGDRLSFLDLLGVSALAYLYQGQLKEARQAADRIMDELQKTPRPGHFAALGMSAAAEVNVAIAEGDARSGERSAATAKALQACHRLSRYARINPPARARALLWRGCIESVRGRSLFARMTLRRCIQVAERFALPYEAARAHYAIGRMLPVTDPGRIGHFADAERGFRALGAEFELSRVAEDAHRRAEHSRGTVVD